MNKYLKIVALILCGTQVANSSFAQTKKVVLIKPGGVRTNFMNTANKMYPKPMDKSPYIDFREKFNKQSNDIFDPNKKTYGILLPDQIAKVVIKAAEKKKPKTRYRVGILAKLIPKIHRWMSDRGFDKFLLKQFKVSTRVGKSNYNSK